MPEDRLTTEDFATARVRADEQRDERPERGQSATAADELRVEHDQPLMPSHDLDELRRRWETIQARFVDDPRTAVEDADSLVAEVMRMLADTFSSERASLEEQWDRGDEADTETLRVTLQRYRSFFDRLLSA